MSASPFPENIDPLALENQLCFPLYAATNLVTRSYRELLQPLGLTYPQYLVMMVLWQDQEISVGELGKMLYLDSGTLTPMLKRMEVNGLLQRLRDPNDERRVQVRITKAGQELKQQAKAIPESMACRLAASSEWLNSLRLDLKQLIQLLSAN